MKTLLQILPFLAGSTVIVWMVWTNSTLRVEASRYRIEALEAKRRLLSEQSMHAQTQEQYNSEKAWFLLTRDVPQKISGCMDDDELRAGVTAARNILWRNTELRNLTRLELVAIVAFISQERDKLRGFNNSLGGLAQASPPPPYGGPLNRSLSQISSSLNGSITPEMMTTYLEYQAEIDRVMGRK